MQSFSGFVLITMLYWLIPHSPVDYFTITGILEVTVCMYMDQGDPLPATETHQRAKHYKDPSKCCTIEEFFSCG